MEFSTFASLAHIPVLLLPVGPIPRSTYNKWATHVRKFNEIRLSDVQGDGRGEPRTLSKHSPASSIPINIAFQIGSFPNL